MALMTMLIGTALVMSCNPDDGDGGKVVASFQFESDANDFLTVHFTNFSKNADSYSWDFGDGNTSTDVDPSHAYSAAGTYTVTLTAISDNGESSKEETVNIIDPNEALTLLAGSTSKTWKLHRVGAAMSLGPDATNPAGWWPGFTNNGSRPCLYEQSITFERDGGYVFDDAGVFWAEYEVFNNVAGCDSNVIPESCFSVGTSLVNACGTDVSDWLSGTHSYTYNASNGTLTLSGSGAWIGIPKLGSTGAVQVPQSQVQTKISITEEDGFDLMKVEFIYSGAYWVIYYSSYANPASEPAIVTVNAAFTATSNGLTTTFVNQSAGATSYSWAFGDGSSSTEENPQHTYAAAGTYTVTLTASDGNNSAEVSKDVTVSAATLTEAAPTPTATNVISIYSDAYTNIDGVNTNPNWGQATVVTNEVIADNNTLKLTGLNYQGIDFAGNLQNVSSYNTVHIDIWSATDATINFTLISLEPTLETPKELQITGGQWNSFNIPLSDYSSVVDLTKIGQLKFDATTSPTIYVDNIYFHTIQ